MINIRNDNRSAGCGELTGKLTSNALTSPCDDGHSVLNPEVTRMRWHA
jgi:hypothetical protein